jgi:hypothetical protein
VINYKDIAPSFSNERYTPVMADIMPSRWAFEALAVHAYKNNEYAKQLYPLEQKISNSGFLVFYLIPDILQKIDELEDAQQIDNYPIIENGLKLTYHLSPIFIHDLSDSLLNISFIKQELDHYSDVLLQYRKELESVYFQIIQKDQKLRTDLKEKYYNTALADMVKESKEVNAFIIKKNRYIRYTEPIFHIPESKWGRAHLFSPEKSIGTIYIDTFVFNLMVLWFMNLLLYLGLFVAFSRKKKVYYTSVF